MMTRKKRKKKHDITTPAAFVFTPEALVITRKALALFNQPLQRADSHEEKVLLAAETMLSITQKLEAMQQSVGRLCLTTFDYNEKVILRQALLLYTTELLCLPESERRARELRECRRITHSFERIAEEDRGLV